MRTRAGGCGCAALPTTAEDIVSVVVRRDRSETDEGLTLNGRVAVVCVCVKAVKPGRVELVSACPDQ